MSKKKRKSSAPAAKAAAIEGPSPTLGGTAAAAWRLFWDTALYTLPTALAFEGLCSVISAEAFSENPRDRMIAEVVLSLFALPVYGALCHVALQRVTGVEKPSLGLAFKRGLSEWLTMLAAGFVSGIVILVGLILLLIPGCMFLMWYAIATPLILGEEKGWYAALQESRERMNGHKLKYAILVLPLALPAQIVPLALTDLTGWAEVAAATGTAVLSVILVAIIPAAIYAAVTPRDRWMQTQTS